ncbi:Phosphatidylinositol 4-kinase beta [Phytophthora boehmeriae]|uniref:1-phosphatidylinositol 4-kinase n=1 Tax=Phytophthora boehmeriae TaxID=109152 RepID=A0A8T1X6V5_9STRA|nr:Phosphatidylinositol 4-kinase beta [Phytophthora boehmeriae]
MGVTKMEPSFMDCATPQDNDSNAQTKRLPSALPPACLEDSSDDNDWGREDNDWNTSSSSESQPSTTARFSLIALPSKVRDSVFRRSPAKPRRPPRKTKDRSSTADTTITSSASSTPRDSVFLNRKQPPECENVEKFRVFWDEKLRSAMDKLAANLAKSEDSAATAEQKQDLFHLLLKLYAHQDVVEELYSSYEANADEFQFYIPQLCTFLLHGNYDKQHQLECFLMSRSGESLPFAHRLTWFLRSFCDDAKEYQSEYLSVTASPDQENSDLLSAIGMRAGVPALLMYNGLCVEEVSATKPDNLERRRAPVFPMDKELDATVLETDESFSGHLLNKRSSMQDEARMDEGNAQQITLFKQTPKFVDALTDLAEQLIPTPRFRRNTDLRRGLREIHDKMLPSNVIYLPIGNSCHRVKGIHVEECFTFSTKERVPYFLCVEVLDYSVTSPTTASKKRRRRRSRASRNQSRVFSLKLPFKKNGMTGEEPMVTPDDSPMANTSSECELNLGGLLDSDDEADEEFPLDSEQVEGELSPPASPLADIEEENTSVSMTRVRSTVGPTEDEPLDGEVGDDEKEEIEQEPRRSLLEDEDLQRATEEQQERMGQWGLPRTRRRSTKDYSSSASARSGGQFDSFYSSWFSKKTMRESDEAFGNAESHVSEVDADQNVETNYVALVQAEDVRKDCESTVTGTTSVESQEDVEVCDDTESRPDDNGVVAVESEAPVSPKSVAASSATASAGIFSIFSRTPKQQDGAAKKLKVGPATTANQAEGQKLAVAPVEPVGIFASLFSKKPNDSTEGAVVASDATKSVSSIEPSESSGADSFEAEDADGEESESKEALPSDNATSAMPSVSSIESDENKLSDDIDAQDADGEDTESEVLGSDGDSAAQKLVVEPVEKPADKPNSFTSWFSRKPASVTEVTAEVTNEITAGKGDTVVGADKEEAAATTTEMDNVANKESTSSGNADPSASSESSAPIAGQKPSEEESALKQRRRDLSVSLDFADPSAWKDKFDLEDDLSDDEPDAEANDAVEESAEEEADVSGSDDEKPMIVFRERWSEKEARIRRESPFGDHPGWRLLSVIVKSNDDLRQEQFAAQLIAQCDRIFREYSLPLALRPYNVIATSAKTGLIEAVPDTVSLDSLKRNDPGYTTLLDFYHRLHGDKNTTGFARAQRNFVESLAAYSIVCYVFQIKDRHNGNILLDTDGHVIHIDFGFLLTNSPGSNWNFERAPFKLTDEFVELMGGPRSSTFRYFRSLCIRAYLALRRNMDQIVLLVEMMLVGNDDLPCFAGGKKAVIEQLRARLKPGARTSTCQVFVNQLIDQSINNWRTRWYDKYQRACLGIL